MVLWLGLSTFTTVAQVRSLVRELRSHKPHGMAKKKIKWIKPEFLIPVSFLSFVHLFLTFFCWTWPTRCPWHNVQKKFTPPSFAAFADVRFSHICQKTGSHFYVSHTSYTLISHQTHDTPKISLLFCVLSSTFTASVLILSSRWIITINFFTCTTFTLIVLDFSHFPYQSKNI